MFADCSFSSHFPIDLPRKELREFLPEKLLPLFIIITRFDKKKLYVIKIHISGSSQPTSGPQPTEPDGPQYPQLQ
jgi:hypothetical protein